MSSDRHHRNSLTGGASAHPLPASHPHFPAPPPVSNNNRPRLSSLSEDADPAAPTLNRRRQTNPPMAPPPTASAGMRTSVASTSSSAVTSELDVELPSFANSTSHINNFPRHHELRRPDSVITTSSIVSSSDAGDSDVVMSNTAYAMSGLYGGAKRPEHKMLPLSEKQEPNVNDISHAATPSPTPSSTVSGHRRQASHPGNIDAALGAILSTKKAAGGGAACCTAAALAAVTQQQQLAPPRGAVRDLLPPSNDKCHRRSNSYGHHRALTATCSLGGGGPANSSNNPASVHPVAASSSLGLMCQHRRAGSSVLETLQTLACNAAGTNVGEHCRCGAKLMTREETIAHFLEQLKREQRERFEKQELHEMQDELEDLRDCGIGGFRPKFMQGMANIKMFVLLLSILVTLQQALSSGYLNSVITTIEKRYEIPSSVTGIVASMYEIGNMGSVIFVSYLGSKRNIPTWIGMGALVMGIGSITFSLPHFISGPYMSGHGSAAGINASSNNICRSPPSAFSAANHRYGVSTHPLAVGGGASGVSVSSSSAGAAPDDIAAVEDLLETLPGLDKIKSLTEGLPSPPLGPNNNNLAREDTNCIAEAAESSAMPIFVFMVAQLLLGCGGSPLFTLGTTYIDNHVKRDDSSMYIGVMYSMCAFGPVCGFLLGAYLLSHHVDSPLTGGDDALDGLARGAGAERQFDSADRHWVGMWWGGFLICGASLLSIAAPFFFFPKELKKEKVKVYIDEKYHHASDPSIRPKHKLSDDPNTIATAPNSAPASRSATLKSQISNGANNNQESNKEYGKDIKDIPRSTWKLLTNKIYMVTCLGACMELIIVSGFIVFLPKYLETQFNLSKSMASMFTGGIAIPGACVGIFLGGWLLKRLQLRPKGAVQFVLISNAACLACYAALFFFGCDNVQMAGTTTPYFHRNASEPFSINLTASCNLGCECDANDVQPVCGADGVTYFSPCHAGCTAQAGSDAANGGSKKKNFTDCACVVGSIPRRLEASALHQGDRGGEDGMNGFTEVTAVPQLATSGPCYNSCRMIFPFMVLLFVMTLAVAVTQMPVLMVVLRAVEEEEKAFALGIQFVIFRVFGYIPSPILFGNVIDSTCLLWKSTCDGKAGGRCLLYDIELFRYKYVGVCCFIKLLSLAIFIVDWWLIRNRQNEEKKKAALTVGEVVNSIISLDKLFEPDGALWLKMNDPEGGGGGKDNDDDDGNEEQQATSVVVEGAARDS